MLHSPLVALVDDELQRVVARIAAVGARQAHVERLDAGGVDGRGAHTCLYENRIDVHPFQLVERACHFLLLGGYGETDDTLQETFSRSATLGPTVFFPFIGMPFGDQTSA